MITLVGIIWLDSYQARGGVNSVLKNFWRFDKIGF